jgi:hypothetical protein
MLGYNLDLATTFYNFTNSMFISHSIVWHHTV